MVNPFIGLGPETDHDDSTFDVDPDEEYTPAWHFYRSDTKLTDLQPATRMSRLFSAFSDPQPDDSPGGFTVNDLAVKIAISKGSWSVTFDNADAGKSVDDQTSTDKKREAEARRVGLKLGTVLFQGTQIGGHR